MMFPEGYLDATVSEFLLKTCRLRPQPNECATEAAFWCGVMAAGHLDDEAHYIPTITGSVAEFYIDPMLPHIGDIDMMCHVSIQLAIPRGQSPPTQLPAEFSNYVQVFEIIDSHLPGYVYLKLRYLLTECDDDGKYNAVEYDEEGYAVSRPYDMEGLVIHGPAVMITGSVWSYDRVYCVRCLCWPPQAADWPTRHRNYDWPDSATVDLVVNNGCDVVGVAHRQCRQHEWMGKNQWRLSFSRAEIVLLNRWMPVQQIVYHMLRFFTKAERLTDSTEKSGASKLNNYHIKTLILWASELKPKSWWTNDVKLVRISVILLHTLGSGLLAHGVHITSSTTVI